ncbi:hypothetical protein NBM05_08460 [Rothia sp. AR01]|uniref:Uncharacterized protein n=1 Tax=Rothia santali TaxID=2949643 RepID=A0A9X2HJH8_9MICC|nr:hypothetical protein [Rothia santali]MCP3426033.1 hypothetical protein [Rothia santali]
MTDPPVPTRTLSETLLFCASALIGAFAVLTLFTALTFEKPSAAPVGAGTLAILLAGLGYLARLTRLVTAWMGAEATRVESSKEH